MSGSSADEADDNGPTLAAAVRNENEALAREIKEEVAARKTLTADLVKARARNTRLRSDFEALTSGGDAMFLQLEQQRARRMGPIWWACVLLTLAWTLGAL